MNIIHSIHVLGLLVLLVLAPAAPAPAALPVSEMVRIGETVFRPLLTAGCGFPEEIHIIGASKFRTFLATARRVIELVVDWAECMQLLPFSITLFWLPVRGVGHVSRLLNAVGSLVLPPLPPTAAHAARPRCLGAAVVLEHDDDTAGNQRSCRGS